MAADPSYPLFPIASILCAACLFVLLVINFIRRAEAFNLAVNILSFCLFWETLLIGIDMIIWADNADIRLFALCDIVSHVQMFTFIAKPACTLLITRQLYKIVSAQSVSPPQRRLDVAFELGIGIGLPMIVTGALYYIVQPNQFQVVEAFGCSDVTTVSGLTLLLIDAWLLLPPLFSVLFYCPQIMIFLMRRRRLRAESFGKTSVESSIPRHAWDDDGGARLLILGCLDLILSLPVGVLNVGLDIRGDFAAGLPFVFYPGWTSVHDEWAPLAFTYEDLKLEGRIGLLEFYLSAASSIVLGFSIFALFGYTQEARAMYMRCISTLLSFCGRRRPERRRSAVDLAPICFTTYSPESIGSIDAHSVGPIIVDEVSDASTLSLDRVSVSNTMANDDSKNRYDPHKGTESDVMMIS